jgi:hypothetical protein
MRQNSKIGNKSSSSSNNTSVSDIVKDTVGVAFDCRDDIFIGNIVPTRCNILDRVALLEPMRPTCYKFPNPMSELRAGDSFLTHSLCISSLPEFILKALSMISYCVLVIVAIIEGIIFCWIGNSRMWQGICLPSSNGYFTAKAVALMYGALANKGEVEITPHTSLSNDQKSTNNVQKIQVFSKSTVDELFREATDKANDVPMYDFHKDQSSWGRYSKGFSPWPLPTLHGYDHMRSTLGHQGMGGCSSFGCSVTNLSVCIMRNTYDPLAISEGAVKFDDGVLSKIIRDEILKKSI